MMLRKKVTVPMPNGAFQAGSILADLENTLVLRFGGYTKQYGVGGWKHEHGNMAEPVAIYSVVVFEPQLPGLVDTFMSYGLQLHQECLHVEVADLTLHPITLVEGAPCVDLP